MIRVAEGLPLAVGTRGRQGLTAATDAAAAPLQACLHTGTGAGGAGMALTHMLQFGDGTMGVLRAMCSVFSLEK